MEKEEFVITEEDLELSPYDVAEYLTTEEDFKTHIQVYFEEEGIKGVQKALADIARAKLINELVKKTGASREYIVKALYDEKNYSENKNSEILSKILEVFNLNLKLNNALAV